MLQSLRDQPAAVTAEPILKIAVGFMAAKHLFAASELGLFEALASGTASADEVAERMGIPPRTAAIVAAAVASLGLIEQEGSFYRNSAAASAFLAGKPESGLRPLLQFLDNISYPLWQKFIDAVRSGQGHAQFGKFDKESQQIFSAGVEALTAPVAAALAMNYDFNRHRRLLDVGGGTGSFLLTVLRNYPALSGTLFDLPGACAVARQRLSAEPEGQRIDIIAGDVFKDELPGDHDVMLVANTIHVFSHAHNFELLKKMRAIATPATRLLLVDLWTDPTHSAPPMAALMSGEFLVIAGEGQAYSEQEAEDWMRETGWRKLGRKALAGATSMIVAEAS